MLDFTATPLRPTKSPADIAATSPRNTKTRVANRSPTSLRASEIWALVRKEKNAPSYQYSLSVERISVFTYRLHSDYPPSLHAIRKTRWDAGISNIHRAHFGSLRLSGRCFHRQLLVFGYLWWQVHRLTDLGESWFLLLFLQLNANLKIQVVFLFSVCHSFNRKVYMMWFRL